MSNTTKSKSTNLLIVTLAVLAISFVVTRILATILANISIPYTLHILTGILRSAVAFAVAGIFCCKVITKKPCAYLSIILSALLFSVVNEMIYNSVITSFLPAGTPNTIAANLLKIWPAYCIALVTVLTKAEYLKKLRTILLILSVVCIIICVFVFAFGQIQATGKGDEEIGTCYKCDGIGLIKKNGVVQTCTVCSGWGVIIFQGDSANRMAIPAIIMLCAAVVSFGVSIYLKKKKT